MTSLIRSRAEDRAQPVSGSPGPAPETAPARPPLDEDAGPPRTFWARHEHTLLGTISMLVFLSFWEAALGFGVGFVWIQALTVIAVLLHRGANEALVPLCVVSMLHGIVAAVRPRGACCSACSWPRFWRTAF